MDCDDTKAYTVEFTLPKEDKNGAKGVHLENVDKTARSILNKDIMRSQNRNKMWRARLWDRDKLQTSGTFNIIQNGL